MSCSEQGDVKPSGMGSRHILNAGSPPYWLKFPLAAVLGVVKLEQRFRSTFELKTEYSESSLLQGKENDCSLSKADYIKWPSIKSPKLIFNDLQ